MTAIINPLAESMLVELQPHAGRTCSWCNGELTDTINGAYCPSCDLLDRVFGPQFCEVCNLRLDPTVRVKPPVLCLNCSNPHNAGRQPMATPATRIDDRLFIGGNTSTVPFDPTDPTGTKSVCINVCPSCYGPDGSSLVVPGTDAVRDRFFGDAPIPKGSRNRNLAAGAFLAAITARAEGKKVLIRCQMGWNRSALIAAAVLVAEGEDARETIDRIRRARGSHALSNKSFTRFLTWTGGFDYQMYEPVFVRGSSIGYHGAGIVTGFFPEMGQLEVATGDGATAVPRAEVTRGRLVYDNTVQIELVKNLTGVQHHTPRLDSSSIPEWAPDWNAVADRALEYLAVYPEEPVVTSVTSTEHAGEQVTV